MSINVKTHPLGEILSCKLFGIETVPKAEQTKMVRRAIKAAMKFYDESVAHDSELDNREEVEIDLDSNSFLQISQIAHANDITFNKQVERILRGVIAEQESAEEVD